MCGKIWLSVLGCGGRRGGSGEVFIIIIIGIFIL